MTASAIFMALIGVALTFLPDEIAGLAGLTASKSLLFLLQIAGALYVAFAMLNWMAKGTIIGGIYNKPVSTANFTHFGIGAITLIKELFNDHSLPYTVWLLAGFYLLFAILFWLIFSRHPGDDKTAIAN